MFGHMTIMKESRAKRERESTGARSVGRIDNERFWVTEV